MSVRGGRDATLESADPFQERIGHERDISFAVRIPGMAVKPYDFPQIGSGDADDASGYQDTMAFLEHPSAGLP